MEQLCKVIKEVHYDEIHLQVGDTVTQMEPWKKAPEGHYIANFHTKTGDKLPLLADEVTTI